MYEVNEAIIDKDTSDKTDNFEEWILVNEGHYIKKWMEWVRRSKGKGNVNKNIIKRNIRKWTKGKEK